MSQSPEISDDGASKKRKRENGVSNQKAKRTKSISRDDIFGDVDEENGLNLAFSRLDSNLLADHIAKKQKRFESDATSLEFDERRIPVAAFVDTTSWTSTRALDKLPSFMKQFSRENLTKAAKDHGSPHTVIIAGAGLRAANITRAIREFQTQEAKVAKLFAKHIKLSESIEMLKNTRVSIGVGTPARLVALLEDGALKSTKVKRIIIDASHVDQKKRGILDMRETFSPLLDLLNRPEFKNHFSDTENKIDLMFY